MSEQFFENPSDLQLLLQLEAAAGLAKNLPFEVNVWRAQNNYYAMLQQNLATSFVERERGGEREAREWLRCFLGLARNLSVSIQPFEQAQALKAAG
jgi:hypothetical protein